MAEILSGIVNTNAAALIAGIVGIVALCGSLAAILAVEWVDKRRHARLKLNRKGFITGEAHGL